LIETTRHHQVAVPADSEFNGSHGNKVVLYLLSRQFRATCALLCFEDIAPTVRPSPGRSNLPPNRDGAVPIGAYQMRSIRIGLVSAGAKICCRNSSLSPLNPPSCNMQAQAEFSADLNTTGISR
jgi:hypothetical protein